MAAKILILDMNADMYHARLKRTFPNVEFLAVHKAADAEPAIDHIEVIIALGHHIPNALLAKAKHLKWVQALTTGTDSGVFGVSLALKAPPARMAGVFGRVSRIRVGVVPLSVAAAGVLKTALRSTIRFVVANE